jgi:hypothetical protein
MRCLAVLAIAIGARSALAQSAAPASARAGADTRAATQAIALVRQFQEVWAREWIRGLPQQFSRLYDFRPPFKPTLSTAITRDPRLGDLDCSWIYRPPDRHDHAWGAAPEHRSIRSQGNSHHWVCPNWLPSNEYYLTGPDLPDEREWIDGALEPFARTGIANERRALIRELAHILALAPKDSMILGQYVRMLIDNKEYAGALNATDNCLASAPWCLQLKGHVLHRLGNVGEADAAFRASLDAMTPAARCAAGRIGVLFDKDERRAYERMSCRQQDSVNQVVWWLSDPLWSVPGNDRMTEQFSRKVMIALHSAPGRDERYNWTRLGGGDALAEMIERYGWMSYTYAYKSPPPLRFAPVQPNPYGGTPKDLPEKLAARELRGFKTTYEYGIGRVHVVPPMPMVNDPFAITNDDWSLNAPAGTDWNVTLKWWPNEHYAPLHPLIKLREEQWGFLRRQSAPLIAWATALAKTDIDRKLGDSVHAALAVSTGPADTRVVMSKRVGAQDRLTFLAEMPNTRALVSAEIPWSEGRRGARSRFGVVPPPPLSAMRRGEAAMSQPLLLTVPAGNAALPNEADSAVALMLGSTTLPAGTREMGIYWETYGITAADSVEVVVSVQRRGGGVVERVTSMVGALASANSPVSTSWREPQPGVVVRTIGGAVPIQMRSVILDLGAIPVGPYTLEIAVRRRNADELRARRDFTVQ